jgi:cyclic pyranopterin phosphate synthase
MPREAFGADHAFLPRSELLSFEEITRVVTVLVGLGVRRVRLTGGEPLLRSDLPALVRQLAAVPGIEDLSLTTNGSLLQEFARPLREAGLRRITVSLDTLDPALFKVLADSAVPLERVLDGIAAAASSGLPVKLNAVLRRGVNESGVLDLVAYARENRHTLRFIEYMDVGSTNGWALDEVVPSAEVRGRIAAVHPLEPLGVAGTADRWRYADGAGELGFVSSVTEPFCGTCTRARLTASGELFTCLFATRGTDLRAPLRAGESDAAIAELVGSRWQARDDRYSELRGIGGAEAHAEMSYLGG